MENQYENIANINVYISENCSEKNKKIIKLYWKLKDTSFLNSPTSITKRFDISQSELNNLNKKFVKVSLHILCKKCVSYVKQKATSQSSFLEVLNLQKGRYTNGFTCDHCKEEQRIQANLEDQKKENELNKKLNNAIENKNWNNLSNFEKALLVQCLEKSFNQVKSHYGKLLGEGNFYQLIRGLESIEAQNLIVLQRSSWKNYITNFQYLNSLKNYKEEINFTEEPIDITTPFYKTTKTLKFKLTINEFQNHPDSPKYAGTIKFKEKIVIEPELDYVFGLWKRVNNNLYLTLTPQTEMDKLPTQKRISNMPISLQKGITDFLNNMGKNNNFE